MEVEKNFPEPPRPFLPPGRAGFRRYNPTTPNSVWVIGAWASAPANAPNRSSANCMFMFALAHSRIRFVIARAVPSGIGAGIATWHLQRLPKVRPGSPTTAACRSSSARPKPAQPSIPTLERSPGTCSRRRRLWSPDRSHGKPQRALPGANPHRFHRSPEPSAYGRCTARPDRPGSQKSRSPRRMPRPR